jgi:hypothetical protein
VVEIDGSNREGGGHIVRTASTRALLIGGIIAGSGTFVNAAGKLGHSLDTKAVISPVNY